MKKNIIIFIIIFIPIILFSKENNFENNQEGFKFQTDRLMILPIQIMISQEETLSLSVSVINDYYPNCYFGINASSYYSYFTKTTEMFFNFEAGLSFLFANEVRNDTKWFFSGYSYENIKSEKKADRFLISKEFSGKRKTMKAIRAGVSYTGIDNNWNSENGLAGYIGFAYISIFKSESKMYPNKTFDDYYIDILYSPYMHKEFKLNKLGFRLGSKQSELAGLFAGNAEIGFSPVLGWFGNISFGLALDW